MRKLFLFILGVSVSLLTGGVIVTRFFLITDSLQISALSDVEQVAAEIISSPMPTSMPPLSLESIFTGQSFQPELTDVVLYGTGDIIPARVTDSKIRSRGAFFPFEKIADTLQSADLVIGNLEAPLIVGCAPHLEGMVFCGQPSFAEALRKANVSIATLENNHIFNKGVAGRDETIGHLEKAEVESVIKGEPLVRQVKDLKFGIIAVNGVGPRINVESVAKEILTIKDKVDVVVVAVHWGKEYTYWPVKSAGIAPDDPVAIAHQLIDAGVDLILGNHPHWVQGVEIYKGGFISYSHGNFIFDQEWSQETKEGVIGSYIFRNKKLVDVSFIPIVIEGYAQPRLADDKESIKILNVMKESSEALQ